MFVTELELMIIPSTTTTNRCVCLVSAPHVSNHTDL